MKTQRQLGILLILVLLAVSSSKADDFFSIRRVGLRTKPPKDDAGVWIKMIDPQPKKTLNDKVFAPCLEVQVETKEQYKAEDLYARVHFFDSDKKLIETAKAPDKARRPGKPDYDLPVLFPKAKPETLFFRIPDTLQNRNWTALVVFGDQQSVEVKTYPSHLSTFGFDYPERLILEGKATKKGERNAALDPVTVHVVKTGNPKQPQITLFLRPPTGMRDGSRAKGVLALCMLAENADELKRKLQGSDADNQFGGLIAFAKKNQLAILAWGSRTLWNPKMSYDELNRQINREMDETFDDVAKAWEKGVKELSEQYGIPDRNFLLWGQSGAAQYACRLALHKPDYFLAIHAHVPSSFDRPTPQASKILWLLTTGEKEGGYPAAKRFFIECRSMGYPIIFKGVPGVGHSANDLTDRLGLRFFEFALAIQSEKDAFLAKLRDPSAKKEELSGPWPEKFKSPEFVGDILNQDYYPLADEDVIPKKFQVSLPTQPIAEAWKK